MTNKGKAIAAPRRNDKEAVILNEVKDLAVEESSNQKQILRPRNRPQDDKQGQAIAALRRNDKEGVIPSECEGSRS